LGSPLKPYPVLVRIKVISFGVTSIGGGGHKAVSFCPLTEKIRSCPPGKRKKTMFPSMRRFQRK